MGAHWQVYRLYSHFAEMGWIKNAKSVIDFGSCDTSCFKQPRYIKEFIDRMKSENYLSIDECLSLDEQPIANMFKRIGLEYACIDIDRRPGTIQLDLNNQTVPTDLFGKYDFVCDNGTFEHILNQMNCFQAAHDLCSAGGHMFYHKPFIGHYNHGFFNYQPDLFVQLAASNRYEMKGMWYGIDYDPGYQEIDLKQQPETHHAILFVLMKKVRDEPFRLPYNFNGSDLMGMESEKYE